jgi:hypothetical protein
MIYLRYSPSDFLTMNELTQTMMAERSMGQFQPLEGAADAFKAAYELAIGEHVEKNYKGLSYLSWPFAFRYLKEHFPSFYVSFEEATIGWPVFGQTGCWLLRPYLTDGCRRTPALVFPLMDNKHGSLQELNARSVSDNIQRASVKCIATFTGLGLKLYTGEDIPKSDEEVSKPAAKASTKAAPAKNDPPAKTEEPAASSEFDGKSALLSFCKANPLGYADERTSMMAGKAALQNIGLSKGDDIKDRAMFANVVTTAVTSWTKEQGVKISKETMGEEVDKLRAICAEGTIEQAIKGVELFIVGKQ